MIMGLRKPLRLAGQRSTALDQARGRIVLISGVFVLVYIIFAVRAFDLTVIQARIFDAQDFPLAQAMPSEDAPMRGNIYDANGILLATTLKVAALYADPHLISDPQATAAGLVRIFPDLVYTDTVKKLQADNRFTWIARDLTPTDQAQVLQLGEPGLAFQYQPRRVYPQGAMAAHVLGSAGVDTQGLGGLEKQYQEALAKGEDIILALDIRIQHALRRELQAAIESFEAKGGAGVILDVHSGAVLAGVSLPDYDPHRPAEALKADAMNRLTLGVYELGSVFKIFSTALYLDMKRPPMSQTFDASQPITSGRFTINDYHAEDRILTLPEVFMHSSNIGSALMAQEIGDEALYNFYRDLGLLDPVRIDVPERGRPLVPEVWRPVNTITASYGHGLATTPMQVAAAVASIVNGGTLVQPHFIKKGDNAPDTAEPEVRLVSEETSHRIRQLMRLVVTDGTGKKADVPGYRVGGKTGTAEKSVAGIYHKDKLISSFAAVFPADAPRYVIYLLVDEPKGQRHSFGYATAGWVAAPAVARVVTAMASILGLPPARLAPEQEISASLKQFVSFEEDRQ